MSNQQNPNQVQVPFERSNTGLFLASGLATVLIPGPDFGHVWDIRQISVQSSSSVMVPKAQVYRNSANPANFVSGTLYAIQDTDSQPNLVLFNGDFVTLAAQNGDTGAQISIRIVGIDIYVPKSSSVR